MTTLRDGIDAARQRATAYLARMQVRHDDGLGWRHDPGHDPAEDQGLLLYGTWAGVHLGHLLGVLPPPGHPDRAATARTLARQQCADGTFAMAGRVPGADGGHDAEYDRFHWTNYAWGAMHALGIRPAHRPAFLDPFLEADTVTAWLARRDFARPWTEGNNIVNLASFLAIAAEDGTAAAAGRLDQLLAWHVERQHPGTGFWHEVGTAATAAPLLAMAGAAHNLHLFHHRGVPVPRAARIIDSTLGLGYRGVVSACIDLDFADVLTHLLGTGHREAEIRSFLRDMLVELLEVQNPDGGFCDTYVGRHRVYGHWTPRDRSVTWVTWFRMATIGMIACALFPEAERGRWAFRSTLGSGFARPPAPGGPGRSDGWVPAVGPVHRAALRARRRSRWTRQRITSGIRRWLGGAG